jgi:predicted anti-sigma-YlaC factor YlaD
VNTSIDCERVRMTLMASLDGESDPRSTPDGQHLSTCVSCRDWVKGLESMNGQLQDLSYPSARVDLWTAVEGRIRKSEPRLTLPRRLWPIVAIVVVWRALQLFVDLPMPVLHLLVTLAATVAALSLVAGDLLAIETWAPELEKRGV